MRILVLLLLSAGLCFGTTALGLAYLLKSGKAWRIAVDVPNHRSMHARPTPRVGGMVFIPVGLIGTLAFSASTGLVVAGALGLFVLSVIDDRWTLAPQYRFPVHIAIALIVLLMGFRFESIAWWLLALVLMVWSMNLFNFMDGADGLAGGMAAIGFGAFTIAAYLDDSTLSRAFVPITASVLAFLIFNLPPARVFMGDAGSIPLGFLAATFGMVGWRDGLWSPLFPLMVFAPFIADASFTLLRRAFQRKRVWEAHREHFYQRMLLLGWSKRRLLLTWYSAMLVASAMAVAVSHADLWLQLSGAAVLVGALSAVGYRVDTEWKRQMASVSGGKTFKRDHESAR